jgi:ankyrin repeat protein
MSEPTSRLPARPSLEQLRKQAKELLRAAHAGDDDGAARLRAVERKDQERRDPQHAILADAQLAVAREYGFPSWERLVHHVRELTGDESFLKPLYRPASLRGDRPFVLADGTVASMDDVFRMFVAARDGDASAVKSMVARSSALAVVEYNYTPPLHFAVREGHLGIVELLIDRGADVGGYRSYPFGDAFLTLAEDHEHHDVAELLRRRLSQQFTLRAGTREIIDAAQAGDLGRVRAELARDATLARASNETGDTALHRAAHNCRLDIVQLLLDAGADPDAIRGDGYRPIHLALMPNFIVGAPRDHCRSIADALLARGARYTMFIAALRGDHEHIREQLRRDRALANDEDTCHHRPISAAARRNDLELVRLLLDHGADPSLPEEGAPRGHALWTAVYERRLEMARLLLEHGADPNGMVESSGTPMMMAEGRAELWTLLASFGGDTGESRTARGELGELIKHRRFADVERLVRERPDLLDDEAWHEDEGILMGPASAGDHEVLALLLRLGARVPLVTKWAPYYYFKHEATAKFLLEHGMNPNHMNWHRVTLLHHMAAKGELAKAKLLVDHGADIDALDEEYRSTPLGVAARSGQRDVVKFLLERGADPELAGAPWATPLAWARKKGQSDVAAVLDGAPLF